MLSGIHRLLFLISLLGVRVACDAPPQGPDEESDLECTPSTTFVILPFPSSITSSISNAASPTDTFSLPVLSTDSRPPTTTTVPVPGITDLPGTPLILGFSFDAGPIPNPQRRGADHMKRQSKLSGFVGLPTDPTLESCTNAMPFNLTDGELRNSNGRAINILPTQNITPLAAQLQTANDDEITTTFYVADGILHWVNSSFEDGEARFCLNRTDRRVEVVQRGYTEFEDTCAAIQIRVYRGMLFSMISSYFCTASCRRIAECRQSSIWDLSIECT
ncbi:hypothetical protein F5Y18DRAFT_431938 [Xylariaceae sp. FL1019]|nr:hypothetical protein F5Y18DRAFT_431938 [Xylariaceae sp. FL1019]